MQVTKEHLRNQTSVRSNVEKSKPYSEINRSENDGSIVRGNTFLSGGNALRCFHCGGPHLRKNCYEFQETRSESIIGGCFVCGKRGHLAKDCWHAVKQTESVGVNNSVNRRPMNPPRSNTTNNNNRNNNNSAVGGQRVPTRVFAMIGEETTANEDETTAIADRVRALRGKDKA